MDKLTAKLAQIKETNAEKEKKFIYLTSVKNETISELNKDQLDNEKLDLDLTSTTNNLNDARKRL